MLTLRGPSGFRNGTALSDLGIIEDGAILIRDGLIDCVGTSRRVENLREARDAIEVPAQGRVIVPAFVDQGLSVFLGDHKSLIQARLDAAALLRNCLQHGTVTAEIEAGGTDSFDGDFRLLRQGAKIANADEISLAWRIATDHSLTLGPERLRAEFLRLVARGWLRSVSLAGGLAPQSELGSLLLSSSISPLALKLFGDLNLLPDLNRSSGGIPFPSVMAAAHDAAALPALVQAGVPALVRPLFDLLNEDTNPLSVRDFINLGGIPVLATAHHRHESPGFSMQAAIAMAVLRHGFTTEQAISAATNNAAWSLGKGHDRGTLEAGKRADLLVLNIDDYREIPRQLGTNHVNIVIRRGAVVFNRTSWRQPLSAAASVGK